MVLKVLIKNLAVATALAVLAVTISAVTTYSQDVKVEISDALKRGDTTIAIDLLNREIELDKSYHLNYYKLALDKKKKDYESLYYLGLSYLALGELDKAEKAMQEGEKKDKSGKAKFEDGLGQIAMTRGAVVPRNGRAKVSMNGQH